MSSDPDSDPGAQADPGSPDTAESEPDSPGAPAKGKRPLWRDLVVIVVVALVLTIVLKAFVVQVFFIPSASMENTLMQNDRILVSKIGSVQRGEVAVFSGAGSWDPPAPPPSGDWFVRIWDDAVDLVGISGPGTDYVKRVIGLPGDHVVCCNTKGQVTVNGVALSETSYIYPGEPTTQVPFNITVPKGRIWVMGDNRGDSDDSRYRMNDPGQGTIPESAVVGRAMFIIWPLSRINDLPIPSTFKQAGLSAAAAVPAAPPAAAGGGAAALAVDRGTAKDRKKDGAAHPGVRRRRPWAGPPKWRYAHRVALSSRATGAGGQGGVDERFGRA
jgi:signal peptidase I